MIKDTQLLTWLQGSTAGRIIFVVNLVLALWVAHELAGLTWAMVPAPEAVETAEQETRAAPRRSRRAELPHREIAGWHLFGEDKAPETPTAAPIDAPETRLNLILRGVLSSDEKDNARAIIADPRGEEKAYRVGDTLPGEAELREIYPDRVILWRQGRHETLRLEQDGGTGVDVETRSSAPASPAEARALLRQYRDQLNNDPQELITLVRPIPVRKEGKFIGFRLTSGRDLDALAKFGLQVGDIVTAINGVPLDDPTKGLQAVKDLREARSLVLTVHRGGEQFEKSFELPR